jgi:heme/copper-type cytochrome/quinol oxidase subunit 1
MKILKDEAGQIDKGKTSTMLITLITPLMGIIFTAILNAILNNPEIVFNFLNQYGLAIYTPIIVSVLISLYNYQNPRPTEPENPIIEDEA